MKSIEALIDQATKYQVDKNNRYVAKVDHVALVQLTARECANIAYEQIKAETGNDAVAKQVRGAILKDFNVK